jgi:hypothetical protein
MQFHLDHTPKPSGVKIDHQQSVFLIGSCFAENIGNLFQQHYFYTCINPNGILFNPKSIYHSLINCLENKEMEDSSILNRNNLYLSYLHHSSIYHHSKEDLMLQLGHIQQQTNRFLKSADHLILTFGSAFVYKHKKTHRVVANCHKQPAVDFEKTLLSIEEIVTNYSELLDKLKVFNPKLKIILTVSPVKYLKDGIEENNLSKATLLLAIHELCKNRSCIYFPAYELVTDDLRDYRFYKEDMAHPNEQAIAYVWEKFSNTYFSANTKQLNKELLSIRHSEQHQLLFPESEEARLFLSGIQKRKEDILIKHPYIRF